MAEISSIWRETADRVAEEYDMIYTKKNGFMRYDSETGAWRSESGIDLEILCDSICRETAGGSSSNSRKELIAAMRISMFSNAEFDKDDFVVNFKNVAVNVKDMSTIKDTKDMYITRVIPHEVDLIDGNTKEFDTFVGDGMICNNFSRTEGIKYAIFLEMIGCCLVRGAKFDKFHYIRGERRSGKTVISWLLRTILGEGNYMNCRLEDIKKIATLDMAADKCAIICDEAGILKWKSAPTIKSIAESQSFALVAGEQRVMHPHVVILSDTVPRFTNQESTLYDKMYFIPWGNIPFTKITGDEDLPNRMKKEIPSIIAKALFATSDAIHSRTLTTYSYIERVKTAYQPGESVDERFVDDCLVERDGVVSSVKEMHKEYGEYCEAAGVHPLRNRDFTRFVFDRTGASIVKVRGVKGRCLAGVRLKERNAKLA